MIYRKTAKGWNRLAKWYKWLRPSLGEMSQLKQDMVLWPELERMKHTLEQHTALKESVMAKAELPGLQEVMTGQITAAVPVLLGILFKSFNLFFKFKIIFYDEDKEIFCSGV